MKFYESIDDMPVYNWFKCIENNEHHFVCLDKKDHSKANITDCQIAFQTLYFQYVDKFGISEQLNEILGLQNQILVLKIEKIVDKEPFKQMFIDIKELELKDKMNKTQDKTNSVKVSIEKYLGRHLDIKVITVSEYYEYLEEIKNDNGRK